MALLDDAVSILKFSGKTALWGVGVIVGLRVLVPVLLPYCKPLAKEAARGYAALRTRLQPAAVEPQEYEKAPAEVVRPAAKPAGESKTPVLAPVKKKAAAAVPPKTKISTLRPYQKWSKAELYEKAKELDIAGRSTMNKTALIKAIRAAAK